MPFRLLCALLVAAVAVGCGSSSDEADTEVPSPPAQPMTMSAESSAFSSCFFASCPITVWCMRT